MRVNNEILEEIEKNYKHYANWAIGKYKCNDSVDILNSVYVQLSENPNKIKYSNVKNFIKSCMTNLYRKQARRLSRETSLIFTTEGRLYERVFATNDTKEKEIQRTESLSILDFVSPKQKEVLNLYLENIDSKMIDYCDKNYNSFKANFLHAKRSLRKKLKYHDFRPEDRYIFHTIQTLSED